MILIDDQLDFLVSIGPQTHGGIVANQGCLLINLLAYIPSRYGRRKSGLGIEIKILNYII